MTLSAIAQVSQMALAPDEFALMMRIFDSASDGTWHYPDWQRISELTGFSLSRIERLLIGLKDDAFLHFSEIILSPITDKENSHVGVGLGRQTWQQPKKLAPKKEYKPKTGYIYLMHAEGTEWYKIGQSVSPTARTKQLGTQGPFDVRLIDSFQVSDMDYTERWWHRHFAEKRANGEWFVLTDEDREIFLSREGQPTDDSQS